ncbi:YbhB/YbcL family Raf kinase inhibitor-like protein [Parvibaculum sedimenti]|uniref:YbhB/YbcL family Raf kinase inhibitor-like protein n=2 Tax=Parvibaculum sedimenti TaxID=2608632 RepID=A0A6N6VGT9_9HYPH|nr:YbhB/YbcL family Raf kinase inhibitor-like protein [Parvibaculum sedimenti]
MSMKKRRVLVSLLLSAIAALVASDGHTVMAGSTSLRVESHSLREGAGLPSTRFVDGRCGGENVSPDIFWRNTPKGTKSFALTMFDPDAGGGRGWWHWIVFGIPASVGNLPEGASRSGGMPAGVVQGTGDFGENGYQGPCPPQGDTPHHYVLTVYALDEANVALDATATGAKAAVLFRQHALATGSIVFLYGRP